MFVLCETRSSKTDDPDPQPTIHQSIRKVPADSSAELDTLFRSLAFIRKVSCCPGKCSSRYVASAAATRMASFEFMRGCDGRLTMCRTADSAFGQLPSL